MGAAVPVPARLLGQLRDLWRRLSRGTDEWFELDAVLTGLQHPEVPVPRGARGPR